MNPLLLREPNVILTDLDFAQEFHKVTFSAINNLSLDSAETTKINEIDIDNYLSSYPHLYSIWEKHDGLTYIRDSIEHANPKTFTSNYTKLKKFSLLRHYVNNGIDISDVFDYQVVDIAEQEKNMRNLEKLTLQDILDHVTMKTIQIKEDFQLETEKKDFKAGDDLDTLLDELNTEPEFGYPFRNGYYNAIFRGMRRTKFMLRSAGTGGGKTRLALADICNVACDMIFDYKKGWISNGPSYSSLFISTEVEKRELQTTMLAFITGIDDQVIKDGKYTEPVRERLEKGIEILKRAPIHCVYIDDFSVSDIEMIIERYIIECGITEVAFDYIQMTPKLSRSMGQAFGSNLREDQILVQLSAALKLLANKYSVYITSSTQLNRNAKDAENRDTTALRGGSSTADKVDHGVMTFQAGKKDHDELKHILEQGFHERPNYSHWVYKNRSGLSNCIIWSSMNLGTMREIPLFVTDIDYNLIDINPVEIELKSKNEIQNLEDKEQSITEPQELTF
ncbi:DnaB-like helicase C-terminal domain-containing protein [Staphylococcus equorum]|uniref:SF4 helicase domain-containing protein n=1 Tax=Staphylococcus equorum TaxID=246432 RepID=A0A9X4LCR8_9STAP|nr:DnaB-like helicase C-terminal domain-containing protein [Staphylococcus equorum]MDG0860379.1 hypothetical protein [Staphylococcus equorum]